MEINTTLLREKFVLRDTDREGDAPILAISNRLVLPLVTRQGQDAEIFVLRAQNMHSCVRMAAQILQTFVRMGPLLVRAEPFDFAEAWGRVCSSHEVDYNPLRWVCVYNKGREIFSAGAHHPFLDVIEKCDSKNPGNYDRAVGLAEETFGKMGRKVSISYEANIGMVLNVNPEIGRCGLIHRGTEKSRTFNFITEPEEDRKVSPVMCMNVCAAFLEGIQLAFKVGLANDKLRLMLIEKFSTEAKQAQSALRRLAELNLEIKGFDNQSKIRYRPEEPEFSLIITDAERFHRKVFEANKK